MIKAQEHCASEEGFSLLEILFGILLVSVMAMGIVKSTTLAMQTREKTIRDSGAMKLALISLEQYSSSDPADLSDANDLTETVNLYGVQFTRTIDITENTDGSKTVDVSVVNSKGYLGSANLSVTLIDWGSK